MAVQVSQGSFPGAQPRASARVQPLWKRVADLVGSGAAILLSLVPFLLCALFVKLVSRGPLLFRQTRIGFGGRPFTFLKLRTMRPSASSDAHQRHVEELIRSGGPMVKLDSSGDPRIIPGGRLLRRLCIDELPQLLNVLCGDMSLVGPRPCLPYESALYQSSQRKRFDVLPGLTGLWQVGGKNALSFTEMARLDVAYARRRSPWLDLRILLSTPRAIIREALGLHTRQGARNDGLSSELAGTKSA